jgi:hypothetical protein
VTTAAQTAPARPRSRAWDLARLALLFLALMVVYEALRDLVAPADGAVEPFEHADQVISAEESLGLFVEDDLQDLVHAIPGGEFVTTWFYTLAYVAGYVLFFLWVWRRHRAHFLFLHTWYWITNGVAIIGYWLYPLAPPRFIEDLGLVDSTKEALELGGSFSWFEPFRNQFAAMPSMHVGQTILYALAITWLATSRWRWAVWLWPAMMLLTVMVTANHFWLDGGGGAVCVGVALAVTTLVVRRDPPWESAPA